MLNVDDARKALNSVYFDSDSEEAGDNYELLIDFLYEVERLLQYNAIKQTPALFKVTK